VRFCILIPIRTSIIIPRVLSIIFRWPIDSGVAFWSVEYVPSRNSIALFAYGPIIIQSSTCCPCPRNTSNFPDCFQFIKPSRTSTPSFPKFPVYNYERYTFAVTILLKECVTVVAPIHLSISTYLLCNRCSLLIIQPKVLNKPSISSY
jgi:hypothetical protein